MRAPDPAVHRQLAARHRAAGQELEARVEECAAAAIETNMPLVLFNLGSAYFLNGHLDPAARWYRLALQMDPDMAVAHQNLACILYDKGERDLAQVHRDRAYRKQCLYTPLGGDAGRRRVLLLAASGYGNVPVKHLLPGDANAVTMWFVEYTTPDVVPPPFDVAFNTVGDPDLDGPTYAVARDFATRHRLLNHPDRVAATRRDRLPHLLAGLDGVATPPVWRTADPASIPVGYPALLRPPASHGGDGLRLVDGPGDMPAPDGAVWYVSPFWDYRSADGYWRKYRMIFVDREPYPYHLAISPHWLVHYATAGMLADPARCEEERRFLENPAGVLGPRAMAAVRAIGARLDLEYAGVDFSVLPDGRVLVFEANATMLVHPEKVGALGWKNAFVARIVAAVEKMLTAAAVRTAPTPAGVA